MEKNYLDNECMKNFREPSVATVYQNSLREQEMFIHFNCVT